MDVAHTEAVESGLDAAERSLNKLIERRAQEAEAANAAVEEERNRERRFLARRERGYRQEWIDWHRHRVELFEDLAERHRAELLHLIDQGAG